MKRFFHHILLADDDCGQQLLSRRALAKALGEHGTVRLVDGGHEAIAYMIGEGAFADRLLHPFPTIVITDLHMPHGDGFDVLEFMQGNPQWSVVSRILLSCSDHEDDVRTAFFLGASAYHVKGLNLDQCMRRNVEYWTSCEVPPVDEHGRLLRTTSVGGPAARYAKPEPAGGMMQRPRGSGPKC